MINILENLSKQELIELIKNQNQALVDLKKDHEQIQVENQKVTAQIIGHLPERVIDKGIPRAGLLATILTEKYIDHLPLYRQKMRFAREQIKIASSTLESYSVYEHFAKSKDITAIACWAHARREFERALENDKERAEIALAMIGHLYQIEQKAREESLTATQIKELRLSQSLPVLNALGKWLATDIQKVLPKSQIGKAIAYTLKRWEQLMAYLYDGHLHIDNNLVENVIRPVALGRKNYLFAGSHEAAQRAAMIYSFFAICKKHDVNPYAWLKHTLQNINTTPYKNLTNLYPQNYKQSLAD